MSRMNEYPKHNPLRNLHERLNSLPAQFRAKLGEEYGWDKQAVYRKMRASDNTSLDRTKLGRVFTFTQEQRFLAVFEELVREQLEFVEAQTKMP